MKKFNFTIFLCLFILPAFADDQVGDELEERGVYRDLEDEVRLNLRIEDHQFRAYFVDSDNLIVEPPVKDIILDLDSTLGRHDNWRAILKPAKEGDFLTAVRRIYPPYRFSMRAVLRYEDESRNQAYANWQFYQTIDDEDSAQESE